MAKVMGAPLALASVTRGRSAFGSAATFPLSSALRVMDWPFRLMIQGTIMGFLGDPRSPIVEAMGMPRSMCVAWLSPVDSESRMAAQLAPLLTVAFTPYFLKKPFSWAITIDEQSVRAMIPNFRSATSGASLADTRPLGSKAAQRGDAGLEESPARGR